MKAEVLLTSPYPRITTLAYNIAKKLGISIVVLEGALDEIMDEVKKIVFEYDTKVIISRGATAFILKRNFPNLSVIHIDPSEFDIVEALAVVKKMGKQKIGFLGSKFNDTHKRVEYISQLMGIPIISFLYSDTFEFARCIDDAWQAGIQVLIGGGKRAQDLARNKNIQYVPLISSENTVMEALLRAKEIIEASRRELERAEWFHAVVEYSHEGIIAIDRQQCITLINPVACKTFGLDKIKVLGRPVQDFIHLNPFNALFKENTTLLGDLCRTHAGTFVVNRAPVVIQDEIRGTLITFQNVTNLQQLELKVRSKLYKNRFKAKYSLNDLVYRSKSMIRVIEAAKRFALTDSTVLIQGESGTGKELLAQGIHLAHPIRQYGPFVALNCAIITGNLLESELFGYEEGSFTGAKKGGKAGLFELAHGGTIFLDEIGKMPLELQGGLLRVLQEKEIRRIGGSEVIPVNVRVIAATNEDLEEMVNQGKFREDLYYRLRVLTIRIPPLRERIEDIEELANFFLTRYSRKYKKKVSLSKSAVKMLKQYSWPGNVRQLENFIERYVLIFEEGDKPELVLKRLLHEEFKEKESSIVHEMDEHMNLRDFQKKVIKQLLNSGKYNRTELAKKLGISRTTLWKILNE